MPDETTTVVIRINRTADGTCYGEIKSPEDGSMQNFHNMQELLGAIDESLNNSKSSLNDKEK